MTLSFDWKLDLVKGRKNKGHSWVPGILILYRGLVECPRKIWLVNGWCQHTLNVYKWYITQFLTFHPRVSSLVLGFGQHQCYYESLRKMVEPKTTWWKKSCTSCPEVLSHNFSEFSISQVVVWDFWTIDSIQAVVHDVCTLKSQLYYSQAPKSRKQLSDFAPAPRQGTSTFVKKRIVLLCQDHDDRTIVLLKISKNTKNIAYEYMHKKINIVCFVICDRCVAFIAIIIIICLFSEGAYYLYTALVTVRPPKSKIPMKFPSRTRGVNAQPRLALEGSWAS